DAEIGLWERGLRVRVHHASLQGGGGRVLRGSGGRDEGTRRVPKTFYLEIRHDLPFPDGADCGGRHCWLIGH
ncbi:hypothetical protein, partial [Salinibacter altiplanensis]|uniref:hypothetical protein n=1 Tax=Salinibacter altiplanensis TaxID=1803181 RepID=UPI001F2C94DB